MIATSIFSILSLFVGFVLGTAWSGLANINYVSKVASVVFGFFGLILGFYYYRSKISNDEEVAKTTRKRKRFEEITELLKELEINFLDLIHYNVTSDRDYSSKKTQIENNFFDINILLEHNDKLLGLEDDEIKKFLELHAYFERCGLCDLNYETAKIHFDTNTDRTALEKRLFSSYMSHVKKICVLRTE